MNYPKTSQIIYISNDWFSFYVTQECYKYILRDFFGNDILKCSTPFSEDFDKHFEKILGKPSWKNLVKNI